MNVDAEKAIKPLRRLRKLLEEFPRDPSPEDVHELRTRARRLEAIVHAIPAGSDGETARLLKLAKPMRKAAGKVRDMDVLLAKLFALTEEPAGEGLPRLAEHLAALRSRHAERLVRVVRGRRKELRKRLKQYVDELERSGSKGRLATLAAPQILVTELEHWPRLDENNLHEFRIHAKELRYMLQLEPRGDGRCLAALGEAKDAAGEWHDWVELRAVAGSVLDAEADAEVLQQIESRARAMLRAGLTAANRLRKLGLEIRQAA